MLKKMFRMTREGADELQIELQNLVADRGAIAERIRSARELGDLAENAEYQSARADQEKNEARISELEHILQNLEIIKSPKGIVTKVQLGSTVKLKNNGKTKEFQIVGTVEADPLEGKISDESPIGRSLMGRKVGEEVEIRTPVETAVYEIAEIA